MLGRHVSMILNLISLVIILQFVHSLQIVTHGTCAVRRYTNPQVNYIYDIAVQGHYVWCATSAGPVKWNVVSGECTVLTDQFPSSEVSLSAIAIDSLGVKWFAGNGGIFSYNDSVWIHYGNIMSVNDLFFDSNGNLWIATMLRMWMYDGKTFNRISLDEGLRCNIVWCITESPDGNMWFGTDMGVWRYDGFSWVNYSTSDGIGIEIYGIAVEENGTVWVGTNGDGLFYYDGSKWRVITEPNWILGTFHGVVVDSSGTVWFAHAVNGITSYNGSEWRYYEGKGAYRGALASDEYGTIWVGTFGNGIYGYRNDNTRLSFFVHGELVPNVITAVDIDNEGLIWFQTEGYGIWRFDNENWTNHPEGTHSFKKKNEVVAQNGDHWQIGDNSIKQFNDKDKYEFFSHYSFNSIAADSTGGVWVGGRLGIGLRVTQPTVSHYNAYEWTTYPIDAELGVTSLAVGTDGSLWVGTDGAGAWYFDGIHWINYDITGGGKVRYTYGSESAETGFECRYFPLAVGNTWWFRRTLSELSQQEESDILVLHVVGAEKIGETVHYKMLDGRELWVNALGNVIQGQDLRYDFTISNEEVYYFKTPLSINDTGRASRVKRNITIPIGTFDCYRFDFTQGNLAGGYWEALAPDIGVILFDASTDTESKEHRELVAAIINGKKLTVCINNHERMYPRKFSFAIYPNPFNVSTTIEFKLPKECEIVINVYNIIGENVTTLIEGIYHEGAYNIKWDASRYASGIYFCQLKAGEYVETKKMLLVK